MQWGMQWRIKRWCDCMMTSTVQFNSWMPNSESNADPKHFSLDIRLTNEEQIFNSSGKQDELKWHPICKNQYSIRDEILHMDLDIKQ